MAREEKSQYKDTLNLPQTAFDMKANLLAKEPAIQERWRKEDLYGRILQARKGSPKYVLHDGPPYANGDIHMGHALNKVLKDMVVRIKTMSGLDAGPYIHGWDCHGQPIEQKVVDELGPQAAQLGAVEIRKRCHAFAQKWVDAQKEQFRRLGLQGIDGTPYITMEPVYEGQVLELFAQLAEQGIVFKQLKPVHWSIDNRTALADAELEYKDVRDPSVYVAFDIVDASALAAAGGSTASSPPSGGAAPQLLVWTTTPWTLPANLAVAVHPRFQYAVVQLDTADGARTLVIAEERVQAVLAAIESQRAGWVKSHQVGGRLTGQQLIDAKVTYRHPIDREKLCPVLPAEYVTLEDGTGLVHTAPGHGIEDYGTALKHGLDIYCPVGADGTYDDTVPAWLRGMNVWKANRAISEFLKESGQLVCLQMITHSYPHDWRSKTPTIFRATEQWFIAVDRKLKHRGHSLREMALDSCRREDPNHGGIQFVPAWGRNRLVGMLESRPDWCISRQRSWGLPIPAFYNKEGRPLLTPRSIRAVAKVFTRDGSDVWFSLSPQQLLEGYDPRHDGDLECPEEFPMAELSAGRDIFDVWFESGSSWFAAAIRMGLIEKVPVDMYLEGADQHRGWFQLSLLPGLGATGRPPFRTVLTHGYVVDETGRTKMSKSLGNVMNVVEQMAKRGADVLRLWIASTNYQDDIRCSEALIAQADDSYRKIRNTLRFCMGACNDFDPAANATPPAEHSIDNWMRMELELLIRDVRRNYDAYEFHQAARRLYEFCTVQASSIYLSAVKDRLYCDAPDSPRRRATQTVIHRMLMTLVKLLAPILPHTAEEAWEHIPRRPAAEPASVHLALLPEHDEEVVRMAEAEAENGDWLHFRRSENGACPQFPPTVSPRWIWEQLLALRSVALVKLEALRNGGVKNPLDAEVVFKVAHNNEVGKRILQSYLGEAEDMLGVGYARMEVVEGGAAAAAPVTPVEGAPDSGTTATGLDIEVEVLDGRGRYERCARCWKRRPDVGSDKDFPDLSARDAAAVRALRQSKE
jgi:isoleucyl-tRNA synthetase